RRQFRLPLLIGGATTSAKHTAVKIAPRYQQPTIHVPDASRCVGVVDRLQSAELRAAFLEENRRLQQQLAESYHKRQQVKLVPYHEAKARRFQIDWATTTIDKPDFLGVRVYEDYPLEEIRKYIDWSPFFLSWELKGKYPRIFEDEKVGETARKLFDDACRLLDRIIAERRLTAKAAYGFWPAASDGDDLVLFTDDSRTQKLTRLHTLRQQWER